MIVVASAFGTFMLFVLLGLVALAVTAALDKVMGKERALLLYVGLLLVLTFVLGSPGPIKRTGEPNQLHRQSNRVRDALAAVDVQGDPLARPPVDRDPASRNPFRKHSDTRPLAPIELPTPPWIALPIALPPTVPGPAPGARHVLRGERPTMQTGDGSEIPSIPDPSFADYQVKPEDVYDSVPALGGKVYVYILAIRDGDTWHEEGDPRFEELKWVLADQGPDWEQLEVRWAQVGGEEAASQKLDRTAVLKAMRSGVTTSSADQFDAWILRRTVANLYRETLRRNGLLPDETQAKIITSLQSAAKEMEVVGETGKEDREGWRRAAFLLEIALKRAHEVGDPGLRAEILRNLVKAYWALRDERMVLRTLSEYARTSPTRPEPWQWLGELHLSNLQLPEQADAYFRAALERSPRSSEAKIGLGDAQAARGRHAEARQSYGGAGDGLDARIRKAEGALRLGDLDAAERAANAALTLEEGNPRALLVQGAVSYARGDLAQAKLAFAEAAMATGDEALEFRAQACYDLGLTCWRRLEADAALAAFDACEAALGYGASPARFPDETVSPAFGRALVSLSAGNQEAFRTWMQTAREEAPTVAYFDMHAGMIASGEENDAAAVRSFERASRLTPLYPELDGWLARTKLRLGQQALNAGTPIQEAAGDFEAAVAFAARASAHERSLDPEGFHMQLRECWIRIHAEHLPVRQRFEAAKAVADRILARVDREQPAALSLRGFCNYRLGDYDQCIRDFQAVLDKVPNEPGPWKAWRDYAESTLKLVKHWRSLEEKTIVFEQSGLGQQWAVDESANVKVVLEEGWLKFAGEASRDGDLSKPIVILNNTALFNAGTFEEVRVLLKIPRTDQSGANINNITFGVQVQRTGGRGGLARLPGIGFFYDKGFLAARVGTGREEMFRDGELHRLVPEQNWPTNEWMELRIVREDGDLGVLAVYLDPDPDDGIAPTEPVFRDELSGFKEGTRGKAELWIGGYSTSNQLFDVQVGRIVVVRIKE
ncbi:MAG: tetratricopeptide repeat protein [Planctomycetota bacterium]|jgi:tetratricopeptide (TPR) repeat protein